MTEDKNDFMQANAETVVKPGIFTWIITELFDAALKYGRAYYSMEQRRLELKLDAERSAWVHVKTEDNSFFFVSHVAGRLNVREEGQIFQNDKGIVVGWSNQIDIVEVMEAVSRLDAEMATVGRYDPATGIRSASPDNLSDEPKIIKAKVDDLFNPIWTVVTVNLSEDMTNDEVRYIFDRPEEIVVIRRDGLLATIGTVRGQVMRAEAQAVVLKMHGYVAEILPVLSPKVIAALEEEMMLHIKSLL
jgi:hypothetical protein